MPVKATGELFVRYLLGQRVPRPWDPVTEFGLPSPGGPVMYTNRNVKPAKEARAPDVVLRNYVRDAISPDGVDRLVRGFAYVKGFHLPRQVDRLDPYVRFETFVIPRLTENEQRMVLRRLQTAMSRPPAHHSSRTQGSDRR